jgi:hypothetical protein
MNAPWDGLLRPKPLIVGVIAVAGIASAVTFALTRQTDTAPPATNTVAAPATTANAAATTAPQAATKVARPALTAAEEEYIRSLWPIHGDVQRSAMRMSLGQIFYKTQDLSRDELRSRVEEALAKFQTAEKNLSGLKPPDSLRADHEEYVAAVRLFKESAVEVSKMFKDGKDDYMLAAYPKSLEGSNKIRDVGGKFWPNEFPPH